jgi:hypothetical protein
MLTPAVSRTLTLALVAVLLAVGATHIVVDGRGVLAGDDAHHAAPPASGDGCCLFVCVAIAVCAMGGLPIVLRPQRKAPLPDPLTSIAHLPVVDPPPRLARIALAA